MGQPKLNKQRGPQILSKLREYGPLSLRTLEEIVRPKISQRRIQDAATRLLKRELVFRVDTATSRSGSQVYQIRHAKEAHREISGILGIPEAELEYCFVRQWEQRHGEQCARWAEFFRRSFPDCWVVRDWEFKRSSFLTERLVGGGANDRDLYPDMAVCFNRGVGLQPVVIGIEIERNYKKLERLVHKTRSLVMNTQLDGVLFVCDETGIGEAIRTSFLAGAPQKSRRIGRYMENFLQFSSYDHPLNGNDISVANVSLRENSLKKWIEVLRAVPAQERVNELFQGPA